MHHNRVAKIRKIVKKLAWKQDLCAYASIFVLLLKVLSVSAKGLQEYKDGRRQVTDDGSVCVHR